MRILSFSIIVGFFLLVACSKGDSTGGTTTTPPPPTPNCANIDSRFSTVVSNIISSSCTPSGCHAAGSTNGPGALTNYAQIKAAAGAVKSAVETGRMPQGSTLSVAQRQAIICWVDAGAPNN